MAKLVSPILELRVIKTLTKASTQKESSQLFSKITEDCFYTAAGKQCYARTMTLLRERGELVSWGELSVDPIISETVREKLARFEEKAIPIEKLDRAVNVLHKYRRARVYLEMSQHIAKELQGKNFDVDKMSEDVAKMLVDARSSTSSIKDWFLHVGGKSKEDIRAVKQMLVHDEKRLLPTGIKAFDSRSGGIPRGAFWLLAGTTGSGKSAIISQIAENMAKKAIKVCIVPLEMKNIEMLRRQVARTADVDMSKMTKPKLLSDMEKEQVVRRYRKLREKIKSMGGLLSLFSPEEDMTIEEILFALEPFDYDIIIVDYVGLLKGVDGDDQWKAMRNVTRFCKRYAAIKDKVIAMAAQLSEEGLVRYSRGMVEDSSNCWLFKADARSRETGVMWVDQTKSREAELYKFPIFIDYAKMRVRDLTDAEHGEATKKKDCKGKKPKFGKTQPSKNKKEEKEDDFFDNDD